MEDKVMDLPFGEVFKEAWLNYVQFVKDRNRDASIWSQNFVLTRLKKDCATEQEAIIEIEEYKKIINKLVQRNL